MNKKTKKTMMLIILILLLVGVGYASLRVNLTIDGTSTIKNNNFSIKFANIVTKEGSVTPTKAATIGSDNMSVSFDVTFENPGQFYGFSVDVINQGALEAAVENFSKTTLTEEQQKYLTYEVKYSDGTDIHARDIFGINETKTINVLLSYKENPEAMPEVSEQTLHFTFSINFVEKSGLQSRTTANTHAQALPESLTSETNLYTTLTPEVGYFNQTEWLNEVVGYEVVSITIPVVPGDKIKSSSFDSSNPLQPTSKGIRVTYLNDNTIVKSLTAAETYDEYSTNGYLTIPEGVNTICIPWWSASDDNWANIIIE